MGPEALRIAFLLFAALGIAAMASALRGARSFRRHVRESLRWTLTAFEPTVLLLVPCRGADVGLQANVLALLDQRGVRTRSVFVVDAPDDPAAAVVRACIESRPGALAEILVAGERSGYSGKASALLRGLQAARPDEEVVAFADADIRPGPRWLKALVQPLADPAVGIATGYRWYVPPAGHFAGVVRAAWNAVGLNIFFDDRYNFAWGGATAIRADTLRELRPEALWRGTLSEDLALTAGVKAMGKRVAFVAAAVAPTYEDCGWRELGAWSTRQAAMVVVWGRHIGAYAAAAYGIVNGMLLLGLAALALGLSADPVLLVPAAILLSSVPATALRSAHRARSVFLANPDLGAAWRVPPLRFALASLLVPWIIAYNLTRAARMKRVEWRGRTYRIAGGAILEDSPNAPVIRGNRGPP